MVDDKISKFNLEKLKNDHRKIKEELKNIPKELGVKSKVYNYNNEVKLNYEQLINSSSDWLWSIDENLKYNYCSPQVEKILGYAPEELIGKSPFDLFDEKDKTSLVAEVKVTINNRENFKDLENWVIKKDGSKACLLTNAFPVFNERGVFKGYQGADRDISFRKIATRALIDSEKRFQTIVEDLMIGIAIHDGKILKYVNPHLLRMVNSAQKDYLVGKSIFDFIYKEDHQIVIDKYNNINNLKKGVTNLVLPPINIRIYKSDGSLLNVETHSILIDYDGSQHSLVTIQDVTEVIKDKNKILKALIKAEESDALKTAFLQNLSHEIRTPLNGIMGFSGLLNQADDLDKNEISEIVNYIKESGKRLINIVEQIIEISKIETKQVSTELSSFSIKDLFDDVSLYYSHSISLKRLDFEVNIHDDNYIYINSDFNKLHHIVSLMMDNAIKFTNKGSISLGSIHDNQYVIIYVKDTGIGISQENQSRIFEKFSQIDFDTSRSYEGAGIGLAICKGLIQLLDGKIWFESKEGVGSTFYIKIPINSDSLLSSSNLILKQIEDLSGHILVVDDSLTYLMYMKKIFKNSNIIINTANSGNDAIELVKNDNKIKLIIMDLIMPNMDGLTASKLIKEINPKLKIIAQTSFNKMAELQNIAEYGIDDVIFKPAEKDEIFTKINSILNN